MDFTKLAVTIAKLEESKSYSRPVALFCWKLIRVWRRCGLAAASKYWDSLDSETQHYILK